MPRNRRLKSDLLPNTMKSRENFFRGGCITDHSNATGNTSLISNEFTTPHPLCNPPSPRRSNKPSGERVNQVGEWPHTLKDPVHNLRIQKVKRIPSNRVKREHQLPEPMWTLIAQSHLMLVQQGYTVSSTGIEQVGKEIFGAGCAIYQMIHVFMSASLTCWVSKSTL